MHEIINSSKKYEIPSNNTITNNPRTIKFDYKIG